MNIMIAAVGIDAGIGGFGGTAHGALTVAIFSGIGFALFVVAGCLTRGCREKSDPVRYTIPRL
jgi:hypothetical protein